ncbi:hypothetical protein OAQ99_01890 [Candidatus Kapabacteria bacterium]|nr:hypothetical protein [Candidatus Kapabacteria bacterium]
MRLIPILLFFVILFNSCNDCGGDGNSGESDLIYFSARENVNSAFTTFLFDPSSLFVDPIIENSKIFGFLDGNILYKTSNEESDSLMIHIESNSSSVFLFEGLSNISIDDVFSNIEFSKAYFIGDPITIYQTDQFGNLKVISSNAITNYGLDVSADGKVGIIENTNGQLVISIFDGDGNQMVSTLLNNPIIEELNSITWDGDQRNLIYSLKSGDGSTVYRTRIDGFTQELFSVFGQRVTKPFFVNENIIGYYNLDNRSINIRNLSNGEDKLLIQIQPNEVISHLNWSHNQNRLIITVNNLNQEYSDILYFDFNILTENEVLVSEPSLLINNGFRAFSK